MLQLSIRHGEELRQLILAAIAVSLLSSGVLAADSSPARSPAKGSDASAHSLSVKEFTNWLLKSGRDRFDFGDRGAAFLDLPAAGVPTKAWATGWTKPFHMCSLVIDPKSDTEKPKTVCLILRIGDQDREQHKGWDTFFRVRLDGSLERAVDVVGILGDDGKGVPGSGVFTAQDVKDAEVQAKAREELKFWLARAYDLSKKPAPIAGKAAEASSPVEAQTTKDAPAVDSK